MNATIEDLKKVRKELDDNKEAQKHLDEAIKSMHDDGWGDMTPSERAFVHNREDKCDKCGKSLDDCKCEQKMPDYADVGE